MPQELQLLEAVKSQSGQTMKTVFATDFRCRSCVDSVAKAFQNRPGLTRWAVDLSHPQKHLFVEHSEQLPVSDIQTILRDLGYHATPVDVPFDESKFSSVGPSKKLPKEEIAITPLRKPATPSEASTGFQWSNYKPLGLVLFYVVGLTFFVEWISPPLHWHRAMRHFMGFFFLAFAFFKLLDVGKFASAFATYDIAARRFPGYGLAYPWIELSLGILFLSGQWQMLANIVTLVIMGGGLVGVIRALRSGRTIQCACLGTAFNLPMSVVTVIENSTMVLMSLWMLLAANPR